MVHENNKTGLLASIVCLLANPNAVFFWHVTSEISRFARIESPDCRKSKIYDTRAISLDKHMIQYKNPETPLLSIV